MSTSQRKKTIVSPSCVSACGGSPSMLKNRKKKFEYNNGKCSYGLNAVMLESRTEWNLRRLFLRCPLWEFFSSDSRHLLRGLTLGVSILYGLMRLKTVEEK
ncbi:hypothetical protein PIB30_058182 [Stylosanthes scabra]|uniref:Uncharacterized protein n=1 Tax=Stylosanthes scabra TaxID=79078 RepID=A0ABU6VIV8_9FABA|nr:hypothetical protein [Stylosanthes scabra]